MTGIWFILVIYSLTNPIFLILIAYYMQYALRKTSTASEILYAVSVTITYFLVNFMGAATFTATDTAFGFAKVNCFIPLSYLISSGLFTFVPL